MKDFVAYLHNDFFVVTIFGLTIYEMTLSFFIVLVTLALRRIILRAALGMLEKSAKRTAGEWDDAIVQAVRPPLNTLILAYGIWLAIRVLPQPEEPVNIKLFVERTGHVLILALLAWLVFRLVAVMDGVIRKKAADPEHWLDVSIAPLITTTLRIMVVIISGIVIAQNLGYSVSGLVASLGLGGAAIALASKDTLSNLFGSLMIIV